MSILIRAIAGLYALLLRLYPRSFRAEFGDEMRAIFTDAVAETARGGVGSLVVVCLRELRDLPSALFWEYGSAIRNREPGLTRLLKEMTVSETDQKLEPPASWAATGAGMLPFLLWGAFLVLGEIPREWAVPDWLSRLRSLVFWGMIVLPWLGVGIGWVKSFPRWSYPYAGLAPMFSLYLMPSSTPGLRFFNYTFGQNEPWGLRACILPITMVMIALPITRSMQSVATLFTNIWEDWTRLTFAMFGFMPLYVAIKFDEVGRLYSLPFMVALMLVMAATALFYLRGIRHLQRVLALAVGIALTVSAAVLAPRIYWLENGWLIVLGAVTPAVIVIAVTFSPALLSLLRHFANAPRHT